MTEVCVDIKQWPDDSWTLEVPNKDNGITKVYHLGKLSVEQAIQETSRRGYRDIRCWRKDVMQAMLDGTLKLDGESGDMGLLVK